MNQRVVAVENRNIWRESEGGRLWYGLGCFYGMVRYGLGLRWCDGCGLQEADDRCDMEGEVIEEDT
jgi:hypothetical protein